jgi:hypothetical protein
MCPRASLLFGKQAKVWGFWAHYMPLAVGSTKAVPTAKERLKCS